MAYSTHIQPALPTMSWTTRALLSPGFVLGLGLVAAAQARAAETESGEGQAAATLPEVAVTAAPRTLLMSATVDF